MAYPDFPTNRDRVGMAYPDFPTNRDRVEITVLEFPGQNRGKSRFSPSFPVLFRSKTPGKVGKNREKSGKIEESLVTSQLFPILSKKSGKVGISPTFPDLPRLYPTCLENFTSWGRPPRFSNKSGSRSGRPPRLISPIVALDTPVPLKTEVFFKLLRKSN